MESLLERGMQLLQVVSVHKKMDGLDDLQSSYDPQCSDEVVDKVGKRGELDSPLLCDDQGDDIYQTGRQSTPLPWAP